MRVKCESIPQAPATIRILSLVSIYPTSEYCFSRAVIGSLISEYPGHSLISDRDSARDCFLMIWFFLKRPVLTDSLVGYMLALIFTSVSLKAQDIHLAAVAAW